MMLNLQSAEVKKKLNSSKQRIASPSAKTADGSECGRDSDLASFALAIHSTGEGDTANTGNHWKLRSEQDRLSNSQVNRCVVTPKPNLDGKSL